MKFKPLFGRKEDRNIDVLMADTKKRLILLRKRYEITLQKELLIARENRKKEVRNSGNYSRIGIAYYSLNIIRAAQQRLDELMSEREIQSSMNEMGILLNLINGMPKKVGHMDSKKVVDGLRKMKGTFRGARGNLLKALTDLSSVDTKSSDTNPVDTLVSVEIIERLIDGEDVDSCVRSSEGLIQDANEMMSAFSSVLNSEDMKAELGGQSMAMSLDEINEMLEEL